MLGPSMLRVTWRACDWRYRQYGVWLWERILFSIKWHHPVPPTTIRYRFTAVWTHWKYAFWINFESHKTKTKAKSGNPARPNLDIVPNYDNHQQYSGYLDKWRRRYTSKSAIFATLMGPWPWPWPRMTLKVISLRTSCWPLPISHIGLWLDCVWLWTDGRMDGYVFTNSMSHFCSSAEMTRKSVSRYNWSRNVANKRLKNRSVAFTPNY